jgi:cardiolipin synthase
VAITLWSVLFLVVHALGMLGAFDVIMKGRTAQGTTAWALALLFIPYFAIPLYLVFGERRFQGYVRARRSGVRQIDQAAADLYEALKPHAHPPVGEFEALRPLMRLARMPFTQGNSLELLVDGEATFRSIFEAIAQAKSYVLVQYYIIREDTVGNKLAELLLAARARGVRVMVMYDEIGSYSLSTEYIDRLTAAGCQCIGFRTKPRRQKPFRLNFRNHRKIVVVDGEVGFVGGVNIGEEYLGRHPTFGRWRDTHVQIRGPAVQCLQLSFLEDWYWANRRIPELDWKPKDAVPQGAGVLVVPSGPADTLDTCSLLYTHFANCARKRLWFATPYFVPDEQVLGAMQLAALRGVDVRLIVPAKNDSRSAHYSMLSYLEDLFNAGIKVYSYTPGFVHQKVALSDSASIVSTANLDNRSFRINFEITALVVDDDFSRHMEQMLRQDMDRSTELNGDWFKSLSLKERVLSRLSRLFAPIQ